MKRAINETLYRIFGRIEDLMVPVHRRITCRVLGHNRKREKLNGWICSRCLRFEHR